MKNIYERMSAITAEISAVAKNLSVDAGKSSYKAVGEADVLAAVKPIEAKNGVYSYPVDREIIESAVLTTSRTGRDGTYEVKQQFMRIRVTYRFVNVDNPMEFIDITTYGDGVDSQDKAPGKAMTYADKYALLKAYKIITGDDPDQKASEELKDKTEKPKPAEKPQTITAAAAAALEARCNNDGVDVPALLAKYKVDSLAKLSDAQHAHINRYWKEIVKAYGVSERTNDLS